MRMPTQAPGSERRLAAPSHRHAIDTLGAYEGVTPQAWICGPCTPRFTGPPRCFTLPSGRRVCLNTPLFPRTKRCCFITSQGRIGPCRTVSC